MDEMEFTEAESNVNDLQWELSSCLDANACGGSCSYPEGEEEEAEQE